MRTRFGENTFGNRVTLAIDGQETFALMYERIFKAKTSILIANYELDPRLRFVRGDSQSSQFIDNKSPSSITSEPENIKAFHQNYTASPLQDLIFEKTKQGVEVKIIVWQPKLVIRLLPTAHKRGLSGRVGELEPLERLVQHSKIAKNLMVRVDSTAPTFTSGHHEKFIVIDNKIGFCGGLDLSHGKWDTSSHDFDNPLRDQNAEPWHDVHAMVEGPVVTDLIYHFMQRWTYSTTKDIDQAKRIKIEPSFENQNSTGDTEVIALRTWKQLNNNDDGSSILSWYAAMFRKAKYSIYIENQFAFQNEFITRLLVKRLQEEQNLKVIVVSPMEPNLPGFIFGFVSKESINHVNRNLERLRKAGDGRVNTYCLISQDNIANEKRKQIYVHAKVMIVDDKWITIGSANMDNDGYKNSTEVDLGITSPVIAQQFRVKLWREHLVEEADSSNYNVDLNSFDEGFNAWKTLASDNGSRILRGERMLGRVYYYNFEQMECPPPYANARGGNKFKWF
ncbi:MAG TPA: phospholipase D family protein [Candidatus Nitrosopolaris sp.]|nr:phospholipase D family protein [Candidatus Nitrosopolaris sp.]